MSLIFKRFRQNFALWQLSPFVFFLIQSCSPLFSTGNGDPYSGITDSNKTDPDDPFGAPGKTYEVVAYSDEYKVLVSYHDKGEHQVTILQKDQATSKYDLVKSDTTEKKEINGNRVYEANSLKVEINGHRANLLVDNSDVSIHQENLYAQKFDCSGVSELSPFAGGKGIQSNPYKICSAAQLNNIRGEYLDSYFVLWSDIDLSGYSSDLGWTPIGTNSVPFSGNFDGNLFSIFNLRVNYKSDFYDPVGLFGLVTEGGVLSNVRLYNANIQAHDEAGILAGQIAYANIINIHTTGFVYTNSSDAGGVIGSVKEETGQPCQFKISRSSSEANVLTRGNRAGGVIGSVEGNTCQGSITDSFSSGEVRAYDAYSNKMSDFVGGLIGYTFSTHIDRCYSTATVTGDRNVGGLVGAAHFGTIYNSYHRGTVTATKFIAGGILGIGFNDTHIKNSYAASVIQANSSVGGIVGQAFYTPIVEDSFFVGTLNSLNGSKINIGGLVGEENATYGNVTILNSHWMVQNANSGATNCIGNLDSTKCDPQGNDQIFDIGYFFDASNNPLNLWNFELVWLPQELNFPVLRKVF